MDCYINIKFCPYISYCVFITEISTEKSRIGAALSIRGFLEWFHQCLYSLRAFVGKANRCNFPRRDIDDILCIKWRGTMYSKFTQQISLMFVSRIVAHKTGVPLNCLFCSGFSRRSFVGKHSGDTETCAFSADCLHTSQSPLLESF